MKGEVKHDMDIAQMRWIENNTLKEEKMSEAQCFNVCVTSLNEAISVRLSKCYKVYIRLHRPLTEEVVAQLRRLFSGDQEVMS